MYCLSGFIAAIILPAGSCDQKMRWFWNQRVAIGVILCLLFCWNPQVGIQCHMWGGDVSGGFHWCTWNWTRVSGRILYPGWPMRQWQNISYKGKHFQGIFPWWNKRNLWIVSRYIELVFVTVNGEGFLQDDICDDFDGNLTAPDARVSVGYKQYISHARFRHIEGPKPSWIEWHDLHDMGRSGM